MSFSPGKYYKPHCPHCNSKRCKLVFMTEASPSHEQCINRVVELRNDGKNHPISVYARPQHYVCQNESCGRVMLHSERKWKHDRRAIQRQIAKMQKFLDKK